EAYEFRSGIFKNNGEMNFEFIPLPVETQFSNINSFQIADFNGDGRKDILGAGNFFAVNIQFGRYDAGYGILLKNNGNAVFEYVPQFESGLAIMGQVAAIKPINFQNEHMLLVARNNDSLVFFAPYDKQKQLVSKKLQ